MRFRLTRYVTIEVDDRVRQRARSAGERLRVNLRAYLRSAADDVETASGRVRDLCDNAVNRVDSVVASVNDKIAPPPATPVPPADDVNARPRRHLQVV
jgi:ribosome recycling factor